MYISDAYMSKMQKDINIEYRAGTGSPLPGASGFWLDKI